MNDFIGPRSLEIEEYSFEFGSIGIEIMRFLGFHEEHNRNDRDQYISFENSGDIKILKSKVSQIIYKASSFFFYQSFKETISYVLSSLFMQIMNPFLSVVIFSIIGEKNMFSIILSEIYCKQ